MGLKTAIIQPESLPEIRARHNHEIIIFCSGVFDLLHPGHVTFLEACRAEGDILVVMVGDDESVRAYKGEGRPILSHDVRVAMVNALKCVDYCFVGPASRDHLLGFVEFVLQTLRPDKYVVQEDAFDILRRSQMAENHGVALRILPKPQGPFAKLSTSKIVQQILQSSKK